VKILLCEKNGNQSLKNGRTASLGWSTISLTVSTCQFILGHVQNVAHPISLMRLILNTYHLQQPKQSLRAIRLKRKMMTTMLRTNVYAKIAVGINPQWSRFVLLMLLSNWRQVSLP
jgi:hypothetical protein